MRKNFLTRFGNWMTKFVSKLIQTQKKKCIRIENQRFIFFNIGKKYALR